MEKIQVVEELRPYQGAVAKYRDKEGNIYYERGATGVVTENLYEPVKVLNVKLVKVSELIDQESVKNRYESNSTGTVKNGDTHLCDIDKLKEEIEKLKADKTALYEIIERQTKTIIASGDVIKGMYAEKNRIKNEMLKLRDNAENRK